MASGTIYGNTSNQYIESKIEWSSTGNTDTNKSKVSAKLYYRRNNTGFETYGTGSFGIKIGDSNITSSKTLNISTGWVLALDSGGVSVDHNSDGTKQITISASGSISGTTLISTNCSGTVSLDTIPRASAITSASDKILGSKCDIRWIPASTAFRYKIKFSLGSWSYTTGVIHPNKTSTYTYTDYTIPKSVANQFTASTTGTMTATLYTYSDSGATKQVGSTSSKTFKVTMADPPSIYCMYYPVSLIQHPLEGLFIQGLTKLKVDLSRSTGQYGASVTRGSVTFEGKTYKMTNAPLVVTTDCINTSGTVSVRCTVTDSRGNGSGNASGTENAPNSITVHPYSKPKIVKNTGENSIICHRCTAGGDLSSTGTYLRIKATRQYSSIDGRNKSILAYEIRAVGSNSMYDSGTLLAKNSTTNVVDTILDVGLDTTTSYNIALTLVDEIGYIDTYTETIPTDSVAFHLRDGGKGASFGKYCEEDNSFEIADDWNVKGRVYGLGKGRTDILYGDDLNDYKQFGVYNIITNHIAGSLANSPTVAGGRLIVSSATGTGERDIPTTDVPAYILQEYITLDGKQKYFRLIYAEKGDTDWKYTAWGSRGATDWVTLGLSSSVSSPSSSQNYGRLGGGCYYRVVNENHVYVAFNCAFTYSGSIITVNSNAIPAGRRPARNTYALCCVNNRAVARAFVNADGMVKIDWVQDMASSSATGSFSVGWIDGYIDYWI